MNLFIYFLIFPIPGYRGDNDAEESRCRSKSFPVDPTNNHMPLSPQSSVDSDDENSLRKMNSFAGENFHPGMKGTHLYFCSNNEKVIWMVIILKKPQNCQLFFID